MLDLFKKNQIEALLFDLDGTLINSDDQVVDKVMSTLKNIPFIRNHQNIARRIVMFLETPLNTFITMLDKVGLDRVFAELIIRFRKATGIEKQDSFQIMDGVLEMLNYLRHKYKLAIVTTRSKIEAEQFLSQYDLNHIFKTVITRESTQRLKPHPAPIEYAARLLNIPVEKCVMIGDTTVDIKSAKKAGSFSIAVLCGFGEYNELKRAGADLIIEHHYCPVKS